MANKYPTQTASERGSGAKPRNIPRGIPLPANDNRIGRVNIGRVPKLPRGVGRGVVGALWAAPGVFDALNRLDDWSDQWWLDRYHDVKEWWYGAPGAREYIPSRYWTGPTRCNRADTPAGGFGYRLGFQCLSNSGATPPIASLPATIPAATTVFAEVGHIPDADPDNYGGYQWWQRRTGSPTPTPTALVSGLSAPTVVPLEIPFAFPLAVPIARPGPAPMARPVPRERSRPGEEPNSEPEGRPEPRPRPWARPSTAPYWPLPPMPFPWVKIPLTPPGVPAPAMPGTEIIPPVDGAADPVVRPSPRVGQNAPPKGTDTGKKDPQHKVNMRGGFRAAVWVGLNTVTEGMDFIVAMHKSLPKEVRLSAKASKRQVITYMLGVGHYARPVSETLDIWRKIDAAEGVQNFVNMQAGDWAAALGSQQSKALMRQSGIQTGLDRALREHGDRISSYSNAEGEGLDSWLPELDIDRQKGVVSISGPLGVMQLAYRRPVRRR